MRRLWIYLVVLNVGLLFISGNAFAFYCGTKLVSEGDTAAEVYIKCGEPFWKDSHIEKETSSFEPNRKAYIVVEEWTYNFGLHDWLYRLRFENGVLVKIETLGYGYPKK